MDNADGLFRNERTNSANIGKRYNHFVGRVAEPYGPSLAQVYQDRPRYSGFAQSWSTVNAR